MARKSALPGLATEREAKHTWDTFERMLSLPIVPRFYPRWASDGEESEDDTCDRFIGGGR